VIGIAGTKADPVMVHFATRLAVREVPFAVLDLMELAQCGDWSLSVPPQPSDRIDGDETVRLDELTGIYVRPIYLGRTPGTAVRWRGLLDGFTAWLAETELHVVNRPNAHLTNSLKPAHYAWLQESGFLVPASLTSEDPRRIADFVAAGRSVVKPLCGARATTREVTVAELQRLAVTEGPILVQRLIEGDDVRAHVVGDRVIACRFSSTAIDYRSDRAASRSAVDIPAELARQLVSATAQQGLSFAGWDFKVDRDGTYWCLECNPMPGYTFYDRVCDGAISDALIDELSSPGKPGPPANDR